MRGLRRALASAAMLSMLGAPLQVLAQAGRDSDKASGLSPQDRALAEALFREAKKLGDAGKIAEACSKFEESQRLDPALGTLLHLAACYETQGKIASAWAAYGGAQLLAERAKQQDRAALARERAAELEKKLSRVVISVTEPADGMTVAMDGRTLGAAMLSTALPIDPGEHVISVDAPGKQRWTAQLDIGEGPDTLTLKVPALEDVPEQRLSEPEPPPPPPTPVAREPEPTTTGSLIAGFVLGGVGLAAVGVGSYFGLRAASQANDADQHCSGSLCTQQGLDDHEAARASALIANIAFGVGIAGLAGGTYLVLSSSSDRAAPASLRPVTAGAYYLSAGGTW